jgi:hypothetical protein
MYASPNDSFVLRMKQKSIGNVCGVTKKSITLTVGIPSEMATEEVIPISPIVPSLPRQVMKEVQTAVMSPAKD